MELHLSILGKVDEVKTQMGSLSTVGQEFQQ